MLFRLIGNQDAAARLSNTDHFPNSLGPVIEEVDTSHVKHDVKTVVGERQILSIAEEKLSLDVSTRQVSLAIRQHCR